MSENNSTKTPQSNHERIKELQKEFYKNFASFDLFKKHEYNELYKKVGYALFGPPEVFNQNGSDATYTQKQEEKIQQVFQTILKNGK